LQGQLGDCWFISALAVMGTQEVLLGNCFWRLDSFKEFGIFVCRSVCVGGEGGTVALCGMVGVLLSVRVCVFADIHRVVE
jgi:Calpain family cysteine protease